ncbi:TSPEAR-AS1 isoform 2 [Pan troglodytes]|uniref:TSPEAR-AS1 isoform 2 n=1 Tax=Pan troglodytes TaxID=9598 RepID=A0A2J8M8J7_PANTR|nr:TSPEAR-AS1 isoform 2 [Pan troglodytes]
MSLTGIPTWWASQRSAHPPTGLWRRIPAGENVLELDKGLRGHVQLVDDRVDDIGIILDLHLHIVAVTVCHSEEDPLPDLEDLPVCSTERLGPKESRCRGPSAVRPTSTTCCLTSSRKPTLIPLVPASDTEATSGGCHPPLGTSPRVASPDPPLGSGGSISAPLLLAPF